MQSQKRWKTGRRIEEGKVRWYEVMLYDQGQEKEGSLGLGLHEDGQ